MPAQQQHWISSAYLSASTGTVAVGSVMIPDAAGDYYVIATSANRTAASRTTTGAGVAITAGDSTNRHVEIQTVGPCPQSITGLGAGAASDLRVSSTGTLERATIADGDIYAGKCDADGFAYLNFAGGGSSGATPGGSADHFWGGTYDDGTGTWTDDAGSEDADNGAFGIPAEATVNGHICPSFDGVNDALTAGVVTTLDGLESYCIFGCFNAGSDAFGSVLEQALQFGIQFTSQKVIAFVNDGSGGDFILGTTTINDGGWHRFILNVDAGAASLYVDGVLEGTSTFAAITESGLNELRFGVNGSGIHFQGKITACGIATVAATAFAVAELDAALASWVSGGADTANSALTTDADQVDTTDDTPTQIGAKFALPTNSITTVDVQVACIQSGATTAKVFNIRRHLLNDGGVITAPAQASLTGPDEIGGALAASVAIEYTGTAGRIEVTGVAATTLRWRLDRQSVRVTSS